MRESSRIEVFGLAAPATRERGETRRRSTA